MIRRLIENQLHQTMLDSALDCIITIDSNSTVLEWNKASVDVFGWTKEEAIGKDIADLIIPPEMKEMHKKGLKLFLETGAGPVINNRIEIEGIRKDKSRLFVELSVTPLRFDEHIYFTSTLRDITQKKKDETLRTLLTRELHHRVKNNMAVVQSIASQTFRNAPDANKAFENFQKRLLALSKANDILLQGDWKADIGKITNEILSIYSVNRFEVSGGKYTIDSRFAVAYSLALNELATNAIKYGALSNNLGYVRIDWKINEDKEDRELHWKWQEIDGPPVKANPKPGFGTKMIRVNLSAELNSKINLDFNEKGLICTLDISV